MRGLEPGEDWTHFIPGFLVAGVGAGLINVPLASTAVGVVEPARAGMASGINSTLRQVGIATGVATLGTIFSHHASQQARGPQALVGLVDGLNAILLVGAIVALVAAVTSLTLIRSKDFVAIVARAEPAPRGGRLAAACCRCGPCCVNWSWRSPPGRRGSTARCAGCTSPSSPTPPRGCPAASCC